MTDNPIAVSKGRLPQPKLVRGSVQLESVQRYGCEPVTCSIVQVVLVLVGASPLPDFFSLI